MGQMAHFEGSRGLLVVNPHSGNGDGGGLEREARSRGIAVHVLRPDDDSSGP